jgi:hypothetical protein
MRRTGIRSGTPSTRRKRLLLTLGHDLIGGVRGRVGGNCLRGASAESQSGEQTKLRSIHKLSLEILVTWSYKPRVLNTL